MNSTKKGFMYAGGILSIIGAVGLIIVGTIFTLIISSIIDYQFVSEVIDEINKTATTANEIINLTAAQIKTVVRVSRIITIIIGVVTLGLGIANLILGKMVIKQAGVGSDKKGTIIALLVLSVLIGNMFTMAFMIVALCLRFKTPTQVEVEPSSVTEELAQ